MSKPRRPRAETPKGFRDSFGAEVAERKAMLDRIAAVYELWGFEALETSAVETVEALGKFLPDVDRPNAGVFAWQEEAVPGGGPGDWLALRYDLTAPLARVAAQHRDALPQPYRRYAMGPVWRNEKPGPGRFRQFYQCDADTVGSASPAADAEIVAMLVAALGAAGIAAGEVLVRINHRKVLNGVLEGATVAPAQAADVLRQVDKFDKVGAEGVRALLTTGRRDESGAEIAGVGLTDAQAAPVLAFLTAKGADDAATLDALGAAVGGSAVGAEGVAELRAILRLLPALGVAPGRVVVDPSVVRGLGYYTGAVFEAELTFEILDEKGRPRQFGSVAGGGRYDDLVERFTGQKVPATGVSIGVDRLLAALRARGGAQAAPADLVVVTVMDRDRIGAALAMAAELRAVGIRAEAFLGNPKDFGRQLKYADRRGAPIAVIEGADEAARGAVQLKDLDLGARIAAQASVEEWRAHPAQVEVARTDLVSEVQALLRRIAERRAG